jgi:glycosyltransferase involved in cell wall biosynthesis
MATPGMDIPFKVSTVIPAYNAAWCVARAIDSALAQEGVAQEIIVVDDGSTDDTARVLAGYGEAIKVVRQANGGLSNARNAGMMAARGEYVAFLDADDWWLPGKLARQAALLDACPDLVFCSSTTQVRTPEGRPLPDWRCPDEGCSGLADIFRINALVAGSGSAVMARLADLRICGGFDETLKSLEDIDMWMRLATRGGYQCIDEPLAVILKRGDSMSGNLDVMRASAISVLKKNRQLLPPQKRGGFWRAAYAGMLSDYAKWEYRVGRRLPAALHLIQGIALAPLRRGRMLSGLLLAVCLGRSL